jgi:hypothetical protein
MDIGGDVMLTVALALLPHYDLQCYGIQGTT